MKVEIDIDILKRNLQSFNEIAAFMTENSPTKAANAVVRTCIEVVKARGVMFRQLATVATTEERFKMNSTLADEMLALVRDLERFYTKVESNSDE